MLQCMYEVNRYSRKPLTSHNVIKSTEVKNIAFETENNIEKNKEKEMENTICCNCFQELSGTEIMEFDGGVSLQTYELAVLGVTTTVGIAVSAANPIVGAGIILTGWSMCMEAEEYGRSQR